MIISVVNERSISKYLGFKVKKSDDLMEDSRCEKFIKENEKYFSSTEGEDFAEFFRKTGIRLEHSIMPNIKFNFLGFKIEDFRKVYDCDLLILDKDNDYTVKNNVLYNNGKEIRNIEKEIIKQNERKENYEKINDQLMWVFNNPGYFDEFEREKEKIIYYYHPEYNSIKDVKQIIITPYDDIFTLTENGTLYCNDKIYAKGVEYIFEQDCINKIIIYEDKKIEYLTASCYMLKSDIPNDKILYNDSSLITLQNKKVTIISKDYDEYVGNKSATVEFQGIEDIEFGNNYEYELILKIGKEEILLDLWSLNSENI